MVKALMFRGIWGLRRDSGEAYWELCRDGSRKHGG